MSYKSLNNIELLLSGLVRGEPRAALQGAKRDECGGLIRSKRETKTILRGFARAHPKNVVVQGGQTPGWC